MDEDKLTPFLEKLRPVRVTRGWEHQPPPTRAMPTMGSATREIPSLLGRPAAQLLAATGGADSDIDTPPYHESRKDYDTLDTARVCDMLLSPVQVSCATAP